MDYHDKIEAFKPVLAQVLLHGILKLSGVNDDKIKRAIELAKVSPKEAFLIIYKKIKPKYLYDLSILLREIHQMHQTLI